MIALLIFVCTNNDINYCYCLTDAQERSLLELNAALMSKVQLPTHNSLIPDSISVEMLKLKFIFIHMHAHR